MTEKEAREAMHADLARSGLKAEDVGAALVGKEKLARLFPKAGVEWAYALPYSNTYRTGPKVVRYRVLAWQPLPFGAQREKPPKYLQPANTPPGAYFWSLHSWDACFTGSGEIIIVEGEKKAAAGCKAGFNVVGLGGVWSWKASSRGISLLPELAAINWQGRHVYLCFDSDASTNPEVARALVELTKKLSGLGALVHDATIPTLVKGEKAGLDDFLVAKGADAFRRLLDEAALRVGEATERLWALNATHAIITSPTMVLEENVPNAFDEPETRFHKWGDWSTVVMADQTVTELVAVQGRAPRAVQTPLAKLWNEWPARRCFSQVTYMPGHPRVLNHGSVYNSWRSLGVEPKKGDVRLWKELLSILFDGSPKEHVLWFEQWLGYPLKHLGTKMASAVGMWGAQGVGKSLIPLVTMGPIYGRNFVSVQQPVLESDFNDWAVDRQFVLIDEVSAEDSRHRGSLLKHLITSSRILVNRKGLPRYEVPDYLNYYLASNSPRAFDLDEDDRRFFVHKVKTEKRLPADFAHAYCDVWLGRVNRSNVYRGSGHAALLHYFMHELDYEGFQPDRPPMTAAKRDMVEVGRHPAVHWLLTFDEREQWAKGGKREVWTPTELASLYRIEGPRGADGMSNNGFGSHISSARLPRWNGTDKGDSIRLVAVTNYDKWRTATPREWLAEYHRTGGKF